MQYERLQIDMDLCEVALQEAARLLGQAQMYDLRVSAHEDVTYREIAKMMAPYANLIVEPDFSRDEWCLSANGRAVGSKGA